MRPEAPQSRRPFRSASRGRHPLREGGCAARAPLAACRSALRLLPLAFILILPACGERSPAPVLPERQGRDLPDQESWDATITFTDSGRVTGVLRAGYIGKYLGNRSTLLDSGITVDFFNEQYQHTSVLTARRGKVNDATNDFTAWGNVVVRSDSGTVLKTEELHWNNERRRVHTEAYVEIVSPTEEIRGMGLESDQSLKHYTILRVTGEARQK